MLERYFFSIFLSEGAEALLCIHWLPAITDCTDWATCHANTGGTAFPIWRSVSRNFASKRNVSGND
jgi:hypothetical protein